MINRLFNKILRQFGYKINKIDKSLDCFFVQRSIVNNSNPIIFDIGAHTGWITRQYIDKFPQSKLFCFEPFPSSFKQLEEKYKLNDSVKTFQVAISNKIGQTEFFCNKNEQTNSILEPNKKGNFYWGNEMFKTIEKISVNTDTIDNIMNKNSINHIDILKLDVQGHEIPLLQGAEIALQNKQIDLIYMEITNRVTYKQQKQFHEHLEFVNSLGYELLDLFNLHRSNFQLLQADAIFISPKLKKQIENKN